MCLYHYESMCTFNYFDFYFTDLFKPLQAQASQTPPSSRFLHLIYNMCHRIDFVVDMSRDLLLKTVRLINHSRTVNDNQLRSVSARQDVSGTMPLCTGGMQREITGLDHLDCASLSGCCQVTKSDILAFRLHESLCLHNV